MLSESVLDLGAGTPTNVAYSAPPLLKERAAGATSPQSELLDDIERFLDLVERHLHLLGDLFGARFAAQPAQRPTETPLMVIPRVRKESAGILIGCPESSPCRITHPDVTCSWTT
jgi:hypothetical protein